MRTIQSQPDHLLLRLNMAFVKKLYLTSMKTIEGPPAIGDVNVPDLGGMRQQPVGSEDQMRWSIVASHLRDDLGPRTNSNGRYHENWTREKCCIVSVYADEADHLLILQNSKAQVLRDKNEKVTETAEVNTKLEANGLSYRVGVNVKKSDSLRAICNEVNSVINEEVLTKLQT